MNYSDKFFYGFVQSLGKCRDIIPRPLVFRSLNSSIGVETRLRDGRSVVRIPAGARDLSLIQNVQSGSGAHPAISPAGKVAA
jgi:hypothetical protein